MSSSNPQALKPLSPQALKTLSPQALTPSSPKAKKSTSIKHLNPQAQKLSNPQTLKHQRLKGKSHISYTNMKFLTPSLIMLRCCCHCRLQPVWLAVGPVCCKPYIIPSWQSGTTFGSWPLRSVQHARRCVMACYYWCCWCSSPDRPRCCLGPSATSLPL